MSDLAQEVVAWFRMYENGLDVADCPSESAFFGDYAEYIQRATDQRAAVIEALRDTIRYVGDSGNDPVVAECRDFLAKAEGAT